MASQAKRWAILIGVNFYPNPDQRLEGAVNDVNDIHSYLERYYGPIIVSKFSADVPENPSQTTPKGSPTSWPTYDNVTDALTKVAQAAVPGDFVYIHYSGHGTLRPTTALEYRDDDGSDAALVLLNPGIGNHVRYLRGIELASLLDSMVAKELNLVVTLDCCHSGAVTRGNRSRVRGVPWDYQTDAAFPLEAISFTVTRLAKRGSRLALVERHWLVKPDRYTLIAACGSNEVARECEGKDGRPHGALSYFLFQALSFASRNRSVATLGNIYSYICARLHIPLPHQHPKLLGTRNAVFMGTESNERCTSSMVSVMSTLPDRQVILDIGLAHGASLGDEYVLSPAAWLGASHVKAHDEEIICKITSAFALQSEAEIQGDYHIRKVQSGWHAILSRHSRPKAYVLLCPEIDSKWKVTINQSSWLRTTDDIAITVVPSFQVRPTGDREYSILDSLSNQIPHIPTVAMTCANSLHRVLVILEHLVKFANIEAFENQWNDLSDEDCNIELKLVDGPCKKIGNTLVVKDGAKVAVSFLNQTQRPLYLTVLNLQPLRRITRIYPSVDGGDYKEVNPRDHNFKGRISFKMKMTVPDTIKATGQTQSEDVLKFIVTTEPRSFQAFELPELSAERLSEAKRDPDNSMMSLLLDMDKPEEAVARIRSDERKARMACRNFTVRTVINIDGDL